MRTFFISVVISLFIVYEFVFMSILKKCLISSAIAALSGISLYAVYVYASYRRLPKKMRLSPRVRSSVAIPANTPLRLATWNTGYGAYSQDYSFFMDGGRESRARSAQDVCANLAGIVQTLKDEKIDIALLQEVDIDGDRSRHVNEWEYYSKAFPNFDGVFAMNYDSPYLFWPPFDPIGKAKSGIALLSRYRIGASRRESLPISNGLKKIVDLDRCYSVSEFDVSNGRKLSIYHVHFTAYGGGHDIAHAQIDRLFSDIRQRLREGHDILCAGDFNHDLPKDSVKRFNGDVSAFGWCQPFIDANMPDELVYVSPENPEIPTSRLLDKPYDKAASFVATIDGFLASKSIHIVRCHHVDAEFKNTDHNPVVIEIEFL